MNNNNGVYYTNVPDNKIEGRRISYTMPRSAYNALFKDKEKRDPQKAIDYINQTYGLLGTVVELHLENN